jgi:hypothetical protein
MVYRGADSCQIGLERAERGQKAGESQKSGGNQLGLMLVGKKRIPRNVQQKAQQ